MKHRHKNELDIPPIAQADPKALEIARIWETKEKQHVILRAELWEQPECWGLMLVDLARHVADAYHQLQRCDKDEVLERIKTMLDLEWEEPTGNATGELRD